MAKVVSNQTFAIEVEPQTFDEVQGGPVTGVIFFDLETVQFPGRGWSDFPVVVMSWWLEAGLQLVSGPMRGELFRFMDGPYRVDVQSSGVQDCLLQFIDEHGSGKHCGEWRGPAIDVVKKLQTSANLIDRSCTARGWESRDLTNLRRLAIDLRGRSRSA